MAAPHLRTCSLCEALCGVAIDPGVRGFEFNAPAAKGAYTRLTLRDPQHTYEYEAVSGP